MSLWARDLTLTHIPLRTAPPRVYSKTLFHRRGATRSGRVAPYAALPPLRVNEGRPLRQSTPPTFIKSFRVTAIIQYSYNTTI